MRRFTEANAVVFQDFDLPGSGTGTMTNVNSTNWIDVSKYHRVTCLLFRTVGTGAVQDAGLFVSAAATGTSAVVVGSTVGSTNATGVLVAANGSAGAPDIGLVVLEASWDEIAAALPGGRYISARASLTTGTDEFGAIYILSEPRYPQAGLTVSGNDL